MRPVNADAPAEFAKLLRQHAHPFAPTQRQKGGHLRAVLQPAGQDRVNAVTADVSIGTEPDSQFDVGVKDIFALPGHVPQGGSHLPLNAPEKPGAVVRNLLRSGGHITAILNMDELAAGGSGENRRYGRCLNPWNTGHLSGGSSGGSAAAVASGLLAMSLGSDTGGSIRIPAAWCGVTGHKPTFGLVSGAGTLARSRSVDCIGPIARDAEGCAGLLNVIAGASHGGANQEQPIALRIAVPILPEGSMDAVIRDALDKVGDVFRALGCTLAPGPAPDFGAMNRAHQTLVRAEAAQLYADLILAWPGLAAPAIQELILSGRDISAEDWAKAAIGRHEALKRNLSEIFGEADFLLLPVTPTIAPEYLAGKRTSDWMGDQAIYTRFVNYLGLPATAFPVGLSRSGLPVAAQIVGRPFADMQCLSAVQAYQDATDHHQRRRPPLWIGGA